MVKFSRKDSFTFNVYALDVVDLGMQFRLLQWGTTETGLCNSVSMSYLSASHQHIQKAVQILLVDLVATNRTPELQSSDSRRQQALLESHQSLYTRKYRDVWFLHMRKEDLKIEALPQTPAVLDFWVGPKRKYWMWRAFLGEVAFHAVFSGFEGSEARTIMRRLVRVTPDSNLAEWHDGEQQAYMKRISYRENGR